MSKWFQWMILAQITGSPLGALLILVVVWWTVDRFTFQFLPHPLRGLLRQRRVAQLRRLIAMNPSDRRARFELADILVQQRRFKGAVDVLRPNIEAGDEDVATMFLYGRASTGAGLHEQAERALKLAEIEDASYRGGEIDLELGRARLGRGDLAGAAEALERFCARRRSTVEGRVLLARVRARGGDGRAAAKLRDEAWSEYASSPASQRRRERWWAWRAKPQRPAAYAAAAMVAGLCFGEFIAPTLACIPLRGAPARTRRSQAAAMVRTDTGSAPETPAPEGDDARGAD